ncbi:MAG: hypothetical protein Q8N18_13985 [Opitutaceae bacterium]|nr:hypothetical protein [Opitutaceae bacterium]
MWRNRVDGARDMWSAATLGAGTWWLKACPMDGGQIVAEDGGFATIWRRSGEVFFDRPGQSEQKLAPGTQPVAGATAKGSIAVWQQGADRLSVSPGDSAPPRVLARNARFPALATIPDTDRVVLAHERGADAVVALLPDSPRRGHAT